MRGQEGSPPEAPSHILPAGRTANGADIHGTLGWTQTRPAPEVVGVPGKKRRVAALNSTGKLVGRCPGSFSWHSYSVPPTGFFAS